MAALHRGCSDFSDDGTGGDEDDYLPGPDPQLRVKHSKPGTDPDADLVTTGVLNNLLVELQKNILTDVTTLRGELQGLTGSITKLEDSSQEQQRTMALLQRDIQDLCHQNMLFERQFAAQENMRRRLNLKVRGSRRGYRRQSTRKRSSVC
ncbi:Hypothetical predicted protein [Pelobates cultripes]|uniref:Uncharacterized protein n=1 Tax=Pelobates cultripes TaxID=61616 RepID=A0AAD1WSG4_PELCU|nr:Hypothetical predicted protein [Pelobates cultripes]